MKKGNEHKRQKLLAKVTLGLNGDMSNTHTQKQNSLSTLNQQNSSNGIENEQKQSLGSRSV